MRFWTWDAVWKPLGCELRFRLPVPYWYFVKGNSFMAENRRRVARRSQTRPNGDPSTSVSVIR